MKRVTVRAFRGMKSEEIYGEITHKGINTLFEEFKKYTLYKQKGEFVDIGCGYGKIVAAYYSEFKQKAYGLDTVKEKIKIAKKYININQINGSLYMVILEIIIIF